jgi:hypothetical protein
MRIDSLVKLIHAYDHAGTVFTRRERRTSGGSDGRQAQNCSLRTAGAVSVGCTLSSWQEVVMRGALVSYQRATETLYNV